MSRRALAMFRIGAWSWVITGTGHLVLVAGVALRPADPAAARAIAAMQEYSVDIAGISRTLREIDRGVSLVMAAALIFGGLVCLRVARSAPDLVTTSRSLSALALAASLVVFGLSLWLLPAPPIVLFCVASVAFGWALAAVRSAQASSPSQR